MQSEHERFTTSRLAGVQLHVQAWGAPTAPLMVLLHGGGANGHWWDHIAPIWAKRHRVVALDFRGHGDSDYPQDHRPGAFNDDLDALLEYLGNDDVVLVGHSMGAHISLDHASRHSATRAAILIDPSRGAGKKSRRRARLALAFRRTYQSREEAIDRYRFLPPSERASESLRESIARHSIRQEDDGRFGYKFDPLWFGLPSRQPPDIAAIECPTLIIRGGESGLLTEEGARELTAQLAKGYFAEIPKAGHHVLLDQPQLLADEVARFLAEVEMV